MSDASNEEKIYDLTVNIDPDGAVNLEQDAGCGEVERILLHPIHVRHLAEKVGLIREPDTDDRPSYAELQREISRLQRALIHIRGKVVDLHGNLLLTSGMGHEEIGRELDATALIWDMLDFVCADFAAPAVPDASSGTPGACPQGQQRDNPGAGPLFEQAAH